MKEIVQNRSASEQNTRVADIFRKYQAQLKGFISRRVSSKEDSEDILQNVFYQFMKYDQEDSPIEQIAAWLYSVARSQIIDRSRKHREEEMPYLSASEEDGTFLKELADSCPTKTSRRKWIISVLPSGKSWNTHYWNYRTSNGPSLN